MRDKRSVLLLILVKDSDRGKAAICGSSPIELSRRTSGSIDLHTLVRGSRYLDRTNQISQLMNAGTTQASHIL